MGLSVTAQSHEHVTHADYNKSTTPSHLVYLERTKLTCCTCLKSLQAISFHQTRALQPLLQQMTAIFNSSCSRPNNAWSWRNPSDPLVRRIVTRTSRPSQTSCRTSERKGKPLPFHCQDLIQITMSLKKSHLPDCLCLGSTQAFIPQAQTGSLQLLIRSRLQLSIAFEAKGFLRSFCQGSSHVPPSLP